MGRSPEVQKEQMTFDILKLYATVLDTYHHLAIVFSLLSITFHLRICSVIQTTAVTPDSTEF